MNSLFLEKSECQHHELQYYLQFLAFPYCDIEGITERYLTTAKFLKKNFFYRTTNYESEETYKGN